MGSPKKSKRFLVLPVFADGKELVQEMQSGSSLVIFDVRDALEVKENGKICNSVNIESSLLIANLANVYESYKHSDKVYFHCALSQVRGPKCAQVWANFINDKEHRSEQQVFILRGGFDQFKGKYGLDSTLTEGVKFGY